MLSMRFKSLETWRHKSGQVEIDLNLDRGDNRDFNVDMRMEGFVSTQCSTAKTDNDMPHQNTELNEYL